MDAISLVEAKAGLSELGDRAEAGDSIHIIRRGTPVAHLTTVARTRKPINAALLAALSAIMPTQAESAPETVRAMRDSDRY